MNKRISKAAIAFVILFSLLACTRSLAVAQDEVYDPLEPMNRGIFWFNDKFDIYLLEPVARGYNAVIPGTVQNKIDNFFTNIKYPSYLVSDIVQLKFDQAAVHTGRFLINSTVGLAGFFDIAKEIGLEHHQEDFGVALGYNGVPEGFYLVLPILGPSNARDGIGRLVDMFLDPVFYLGYYTDLSSAEQWAVGTGIKSLEVVNTRAAYLEAVRSAKEASLDYYLFMQSAYHQRRQNLIYDNNPPEEKSDDSDLEAPPQ